MNDQHELYASNVYWDKRASTFDDEPDHGLKDPIVRACWRQLLAAQIPSEAAKVLDVGCGTGSLSILLAELGHRVIGVDVSPEMISLAREKAVRYQLPIEFQVRNAAALDLSVRLFDLILCRHLLWAFSNPTDVLTSWGNHLKDGGRLILIEGFWDAGGGIHPDKIASLLPSIFKKQTMLDLSQQTHLWGKDVSDERYILVADKIYNHIAY
ncbi:MAG: class I SAM-dependent methyltransferase [Chloroflexota bacterium]